MSDGLPGYQPLPCAESDAEASWPPSDEDDSAMDTAVSGGPGWHGYTLLGSSSEAFTLEAAAQAYSSTSDSDEGSGEEPSDAREAGVHAWQGLWASDGSSNGYQPLPLEPLGAEFETRSARLRRQRSEPQAMDAALSDALATEAQQQDQHEDQHDEAHPEATDMHAYAALEQVEVVAFDLLSPNAALVASLRAQGSLPPREHVAPAALVPDDIPLSHERIQEIQSIMAGLALTPPPWMSTPQVDELLRQTTHRHQANGNVS